MDSTYFKNHLSYILTWWEDFIDWDGGGVFTYTQPYRKEVRKEEKAPLMHLRQMYNYSVGTEQGHPNAEKIAHHLYQTLFDVFPKREGALMISPYPYKAEKTVISGYLNAYQVICLARYARAFKHQEAAELALKAYKELDDLLTDKDLKSLGSWDQQDVDTKEMERKSDNANIHRCEAALNLFRALETATPDLAAKEQGYLKGQMMDLCSFFDQKISRPDEGYTLEVLTDDCTPPPYFEFRHQSLAHGFEWLGFCLEVEAHTKCALPFTDQRLKSLCEKTLTNGLAPNGCYRNDYVVVSRSSHLRGTFWPQVEAILGVLWARKRWGESAFPIESAERMHRFYEKYFMIPEDLGGGIASSISENGTPMSYHTGHAFKCDHHAVRMVEKILEYELLNKVPA